MSTVLNIQHLTHRFGDITALHDVSLSVQTGELFGLIGPDGAGKSTLIRSILGIIDPAEGDLHVLESDRRQNKSVIKNRTGYLSQQFSLYEDLTVEENIEFFAAIHNVGNYQTRMSELLDMTRMQPFRNRLAGKLSGGMKQKLALSCTLIHHPDLILLDEPTTGVDPISRRDFWKILSELISTGLTIVVATPYMDEAERCHRIALMNKGRLLVTEDPSVLISDMGLRVIEMITDHPRLFYFKIQKDMPEFDVHLYGERVQLLVETPLAPKMVNQVKSQYPELKFVRETEPTMENIFISYMNREVIA